MPAFLVVFAGECVVKMSFTLPESYSHFFYKDRRVEYVSLDVHIPATDPASCGVL
ncbi:hypothetical protein [Planctomicrobium sp. SH527]|uniref:hypothetical protein n=1 Tax=Planctomicrobium sp. SH527 TaxID=3448123 RepID=UPI003F5C8530